MRQGRASNRPSQGVLGLHPRIPHPAGGPRKESPPILIIPAPEPQYLARCSPSAMARASRLGSPSRPPAPSPTRRAPSPAPPPPHYWLVCAQPSTLIGGTVCHFLERGGTREEDLEGQEDCGTRTPSQPRLLPPTFSVVSPAGTSDRAFWPSLSLSSHSHTNTLLTHPVSSVLYTRARTL